MTSRATRRRIGGAALLLAAGSIGLAAARGGTAAGLVPIVASAATPTPTCLLIFCPTPTPTPTPTPAKTPTPTPTPRSTSPSATPTSTGGGPGTQPPVFVDPGPGALPTLPLDTPSPGAPPAPPELSVQSVLLVPAGGDTVRTGVSVLVEATCTAKRGTDTYAVPNAKVTFAVTGPAGSAPTVNPATADSGDTGVATASVDVGGTPGDVQVSATSGGATGQLTLHVTGDAITPSASASASATAVTVIPGTTRTVDSGGTTGGRAVAVAAIIALGVAVLATTLLRIGLLPRLGRRSTAPPPDGQITGPQGGDAGQVA
jgi:hypothetical protein